VLSGHTHAGQVFPGTVPAPLIFRMNQGLYDFEGMQVFVSEGAGTYMP
jgi:predicted MPP superfamily phosphohydrolase